MCPRRGEISDLPCGLHKLIAAIAIGCGQICSTVVQVLVSTVAFGSLL